MTIGIGGWGSRRKPMSIVRAILRSDLTRPDHRHLRRARRRHALRRRQGAQGRLRVRLARLDPARAAFPCRPPERRRSRRWSSTRGCSSSGCGPRRWRVSFLPCRAGLGSAIMEINPELKTVTSPYDGAGAARDARAPSRRRAAARQPRRRARRRAVPRPRLVLRRPVLPWPRTARSCRARRSSTPSDFAKEGPLQTDQDQPALDRRRRRGAVRRALHPLRPRLRARRSAPARVRGDAPRTTTRGRRSAAKWVDVARARVPAHARRSRSSGSEGGPT